MAVPASVISANSASLIGPAIGPIASWVKSIHSTPSKHNKGSVNTGGGGGCGNSGCGKPSPCGGSKKKSKSCGGGGKGCGGSKKSSCSPMKLKVVFKDFNGKIIGSIQEVEKNSSAQCPWNDNNDIPDNYKVDGYLFQEWSNYDWKSVQKDLEVNAVYRKLNTTSETHCGGDSTTILDQKMSEENCNKIQNFSDEYFNQQAGARGVYPRSTDAYRTNVTEYGKYNAAIDKCADTVGFVTDKINFVFDKLYNYVTYVNEPIDNQRFENAKKALLNIQSSIVFQTRMSFNLDLQDIYVKISDCVDNLVRYARTGEEDIDEKIKEYREDIDSDLEFFLQDNTDRYNDFVDSYNKFLDGLNQCFTEDVVSSEKIQKE